MSAAVALFQGQNLEVKSCSKSLQERKSGRSPDVSFQRTQFAYRAAHLDFIKDKN